MTTSQNRISATTIKLSGFAKSIHKLGASVAVLDFVSAVGGGLIASTCAISPNPRDKTSSSPNKAKTFVPNRSVHKPAPSRCRVVAKRGEIGGLSSLSQRKPNREVYFWAHRVTSPQCDDIEDARYFDDFLPSTTIEFVKDCHANLAADAKATLVWLSLTCGNARR